MRHHHRRLLGAAITAVLATACGQPSPTEPSTGTIRVVVTTTGARPDQFLLSVDGGAATPIGATSSTVLPDLAPGGHHVTLGGVTSNCTATGDLDRTVQVEAGATADIEYAITCAEAQGNVRVVIATSGQDLDPDGYTAALDGGTGLAAPLNGEVVLGPVAAGNHTASLSGLAPNCVLDGSNPRRIVVPVGDLVEVAFTVACGPPAGTIRITATTAGVQPDPDGYLASLDGAPPVPVTSGGAAQFTGIPVGDHAVDLSGMAANCRLEGSAHATVAVTNGGTAVVTFAVSCFGTGRLLFTSNRTGNNHVYTMNADGSGITDLTPGADGEGAVWSPDGSRIAFASRRTGRYVIYRMNADGSAVVRLTSSGGESPAWSPDGTKIAFSRGSIVIMNADGTGLRTVTSGQHPAWSPDGTKLAFDRGSESGCLGGILHICPVSVYSIGPDGTGEQNLSARAGSFDQSTWPAWSPDGQRLAFRQGGFIMPAQVTFVTSSGASLGQVILGPLEYGAPVWSPDGSAVAVTAESKLQVAPIAGGAAATLVAGSDTKIPTAWR